MRRRKTYENHGHATNGISSTYRAWMAMRTRCFNPNSEDYEYYGGRGIKICKRWEKFQNFLDDMGERPSGLTLERIKVNRGYSKANCCWDTQRRQNQNRRNSRMIKIGRVTKPLSAWAEERGLKPDTVYKRVFRYGWTEREALGL